MNKLDVCAMCKYRDVLVDNEPCGTCILIFYTDGKGGKHPTPCYFEMMRKGK